MAEAVLADTAASIIKSLGSLALQEIGLLCRGFKVELQKLRDRVSTIQDLLLDAEEKLAEYNEEERQPKNYAKKQNIEDKIHDLKNWVGKLKGAKYEAENLLDDDSTELPRRQVMTQDKKAKKVRNFFSKSNPLVNRLKMGHRIKVFRASLDVILAERTKFDLTEHPTRTQFEHWNRKETHSFLGPDEAVIGIEDAKDSVKKLLLDSDVGKNVSFIPIVGIGGIGKTMLAKYVYNDKDVKNHFTPTRLWWVCVSEPFELKTIVRQIIECATKKTPEFLPLELLQEKLRAKIRGKRYLLVLDHVWSENSETWSELKKLLSGGMMGSKVLITTRNKRVAENTVMESTYLLEGLSESNSLDLFKRMAFKDGKEPMISNLEEIVRKIVQKCARVPLALHTIGCLLYDAPEKDWLEFKNNELYKITKEAYNIFPILKLSYDLLPLHLKPCFAFCSLFKKDSEIEVEVLIQLWIAQGFIHSSNRTECLEDVGRKYFMNLLSSLFFQDIKINECGDIFSCKMHDLIHDLAWSIASDECLILNSDANEVVQGIHHMAFDSLCSLPDISSPLFKAGRMRTLLLQLPTLDENANHHFNVNSEVLPESNKLIYDTIISSFSCLRALNLSRSNIQDVTNSIGKLKHLRFLDLSWNKDIILLPSSISELRNLQTLRLDFCGGLKELPEDTRNLINLRHLALHECRSLTHMPHGLGKLTNLQTLTLYSLGKKESSVLKQKGKKESSVLKQKGGPGDLAGLNELRGELRIKGLEHLRSSPLEVKAANLKGKQNLQILKLEWDPKAGDDSNEAIDNDEELLKNLRPHLNLKGLEIDGYAAKGLSSSVSYLENLVFITISKCKWCQHIPPLAGFRSLKSLSLRDLSALEYISNNGSGVSSSSLESMVLDKLPKLRGWWKMMEAVPAEHEQHHHLPLFPSFPCLSSLHIVDCPMMSIISVTATKTTTGSQKTPSSSSSLSTLSKLKSLFLEGLEELEYLPEEWLQNLTSLETLKIWGCIKLRIFMSSISRHLTALEDLRISNCRELISNEDEEGAQCLGPTTLRHLYIENVTSLVSLPRELRHVTTLQSLNIENCSTLKLLPDWICNFTSLQMLQIVNCPNLISLPDGMHRLTPFCRLIIARCPRLEERCEEVIGRNKGFSIDASSNPGDNQICAKL